jgi:acyl-CoA synthetase (AMP-forming)/AMP-acid ligase II
MTGWAIPGVRVRVVDAEGRDVRPDGQQIGEIVVRGNTVMEGYYRDAEATATAIRDGWLHTGDMATIDEAGYVVIRTAPRTSSSARARHRSVEIEIAIAASRRPRVRGRAARTTSAARSRSPWSSSSPMRPSRRRSTDLLPRAAGGVQGSP